MQIKAVTISNYKFNFHYQIIIQPETASCCGITDCHQSYLWLTESIVLDPSYRPWTQSPIIAILFQLAAGSWLQHFPRWRRCSLKPWIRFPLGIYSSPVLKKVGVIAVISVFRKLKKKLISIPKVWPKVNITRVIYCKCYFKPSMLLIERLLVCLTTCHHNQFYSIYSFITSSIISSVYATFSSPKISIQIFLNSISCRCR